MTANVIVVLLASLFYAVRRNAARFPHEFMFQLNSAETTEVVTNCDLRFERRPRRRLPSSRLIQPTRTRHLVGVNQAEEQLRDLLQALASG